MEKQEHYLPVKDYAAKYKESVHNVYNLLKKGKVKGKKIGNYQLILDMQKKI